ncbi:hypothetical protein Tco_1212474 [Tanacetum coccineum]
MQPWRHQIILLGSESVPLNLTARRIFGVSVTKLATSRLVNGSSCGGSDMVIEDLDLEPKIDAMMRDFLEVSLPVFVVPSRLERILSKKAVVRSSHVVDGDPDGKGRRFKASC